ncbi:AraC family transcriptional regulator [Pedobacter sp. UBA5917]|uniref:AraC family transcriptional regulator n=1 Tax=Pedobacter sp. UBA5917 TaxID=1947061 RepID=UPI0025F61F28|nr:AraC family transcriptional regulator [Pedobacter sp. UBA5917]
MSTCSIMVDFEKHVIGSGCLFYVLPSQMHRRTAPYVGEGWVLEVDPAVVPPDCRDIFEHQLSTKPPLPLSDTEFGLLKKMLMLIDESSREFEPGGITNKVAFGLLTAFLGMAATFYNRVSAETASVPRLKEISVLFTEKLIQNVRAVKSPAAYASMLNLSLPYLNEALKKTTGHPVSYWIQHEAVIEAKRLLYTNNLSVKEVAYQMGYEDQSYFIRLFHKVAGETPAQFKARFKD